jgi:tRNA modification GTPase
VPDDTIYAVSSGRPPAAIAIMRISGPRARDALIRLAGDVPAPRVAALRTFRSADGDVLDRGLALWFPEPASATGDDVAELHVHGGIAVVDAVARALHDLGLRQAEPGEFTRRAVFNGRLDLNEAEGLADLLAAETESQRRQATLRAMGGLGREIDGWITRLLAIAADVECAIDYDDDIGSPPVIVGPLQYLHRDITAALERPHAERLREGVRVAIVGPVNAGKSSLFNALVGADAAIVTPIAGTTRDVIERPVTLGGVPFVFVDTAGVRETEDVVEQIGIDRARQAEDSADLVLDLSDGAQTVGKRLRVDAKSDLSASGQGHSLSVVTGAGVAELVTWLCRQAASLLPAEGEVAFNARQRSALEDIAQELTTALHISDPVIVAAHLMAARRTFDLLTGRAGVENLLDTLFSRFCLGK